ncbi:hypothetical protein IU449_27365 [Nocardia higoensis]|uniref:Minor tail protein n=1 Tax=Nocardia higoensis TaxID=228599 RepID=A0ABS0DID5_9NOCA|nr:hypothetical protein [Nocardia higoensis]MBF6358221.1 hypothetical protein [Nocardia higoensis]
MRLPSALFRTPPPVAAWTAEGILTAVGAPMAVAAFTADGLLEALGAAAGLAGFTAEGVLMEVQNEGIAEFVGAGTLAAPAVAVATAAFTAAGSLTAGLVAPATAAFTGSGVLAASGYPTAVAGFTGVGSLAAAGVTFAPSSMTKDGAYVAPNGFGQVTGWVADTTNYPGSTISGSDLVVQSTGTGKTVSASVVWTANSTFSRPVTMRLRNQTTGVILATGSQVSVPGSGTATATVTATGVSVTAGDLIRLEADGGNNTSKPSALTNTASYVRVS